VEERHSSRREDLKRELDEVLRGIREMGGVAAIFREGEKERERERERDRNLWKVDGRAEVHRETDSYEQEVGTTKLEKIKFTKNNKEIS